MLYGSETWCLKEKEAGILRRAERGMVRVMCGVKLMDGKNAKELLKKLGLNESVEMMAKASAIRWYEHVLRREEGNILGEAFDFKVNGPRKRGRLKYTWKRKIEKEIKKIGLKKEDVKNRVK